MESSRTLGEKMREEKLLRLSKVPVPVVLIVVVVLLNFNFALYG